MGGLSNAIDIPDVDLWDFLFEQPKEFSEDKKIYIDYKTSAVYSYKDVKQQATKFGSLLSSKWSWQKGDVLAIFASNSIDIPSVIWGTHYCGGTVAPMNPAYTVEELTRQLLLSKTQAICTQKKFLPIVREAALEAGVNQAMIFLIGPEECPGTDSLHDILELDVAIVPRSPVSSPEQDLAFLVFSSGTTGLPKAVKLTHRNVVANILLLKAAETEIGHAGGPQGQGDRLLALLPFFHILGLMAVVHSSIYNGLQVVVMDQFKLDTFCQAVQDYKITYIHVVPPIVLQLAKSPIADRYDLSSIRMLVSAAAPLSADLVHELWRRRSIKVIQGYGLSETCAGTHMQAWQDWQTSIGTVGKLFPNLQARVVSADGHNVSPGEQGELWLKGPTIFPGYLNDPDSTAQCFSPDGFFMSGDIGVEDANGNFRITDRIKELIKYKGFQVAPAELEGILLGHPLVADVCVIGVDDEEQATQVPMACVVLQQGASADKQCSDAIKQWFEAKVSNAKRLRGGIVVVDEIPKSAAGKVLRRVMKERVLASRKLKAKL